MKTTGMTTMAVRKFNKSKVYECIYREKNVSKQRLSQSLQMGMNTVTQNLKLLEEEGLIERSGYFSSTGGRKAQDIHILSAARVSAGIEILKDTLHFVLLDLYGEILEKKTVPLLFAPNQQYCRLVGKEFNSFLESFKEYPKRLLGVSIAIQGLISTDGKSVQYGEILHHTGMTLDDFSSYLPYPCSLVHDSKAAAYREAWHQEKFKDAIVLLLNQNLGGAVILDGQVHQGMQMHSGTIEHMCINPDGPKCYCGQKGCLETYCSAEALSKRAGTTPDAFFQTLCQKDPAAKTIWQEYLDHLAFAVRNLNMLLDCRIIISGMLSSYFTKEDLDMLQKKTTALMPFLPFNEFMTLSSHGHLAPPAGAALSYIDHFLKSI